jgi:GxxExxY protein
MHIDEITGIVINACIKIHKAIGPGCFERVYEELLYYELIKAGLKLRRQVLLPIDYEGLFIDKA